MIKSKWCVAALVLAFSMSRVVSAQNLVTNPGFETGTLSGWTPFGNTAFSGVDDISAHTGAFGAFFGPVGSTGGIRQTLATSVGASYTFSFWLSNNAGEQSTPNSFSATFGSNTVQSFTDAPSSAYAFFSLTTVATAASTDIAFSFRQDPSFWNLDDVSVTRLNSVAPEPATWVLMGAGWLGLGVMARRRRTV